MRIFIQCAGRKRPDAATFAASDGRLVRFVAQPASAPARTGYVYARPDNVSDDGRTWRARLIEYNERGVNPLNLLPAWQLYEPDAYAALVEKFGTACVYILSAGWGLISAKFLTPAYDITFSQVPKQKRWMRRGKDDAYEDSCLMPDDGEPLLFLGGKEYLPLLCRLTAGMTCGKTIFFRTADAPDLPAGFTAVRYETHRRQNWHYNCARDPLKQRDPHETALDPHTAPTEVRRSGR